MARVNPFNQYSLRYDSWFERHPFVFQTELKAIRSLLPRDGQGIEIGVGTGRFALSLSITQGVEPSKAMADMARKRGIEVIEGVAESLPFPDNHFDFVLMVTTICFVDDVEQALRESHRVLKPGGFLILGFIDRDSFIGQKYSKDKLQNVFYRDATFYSPGEVKQYLQQANFSHFEFRQTLFNPLENIKAVEPVKEGYGEGSFVVLRAQKLENNEYKP